MNRHDLTDFEWSVIEPLLPQKSRGVPRVGDRRVLNGIFWRFRTGSPWADIPDRYGPHTTCYNGSVAKLLLELRGALCLTSCQFSAFASAFSSTV